MFSILSIYKFGLYPLIIDFKLEDIKAIIYDSNFNFEEALINHKTNLVKEKARINQYLNNIAWIDEEMDSIKESINNK